MSSGAQLSAWLPAARERQDELLLGTVGPLLREAMEIDAAQAAWFERINKPEWGLRIWFLGRGDRLEKEVRPLLERSGLLVVPAEEEDKWVGGAAERERLKLVHHRDARACLETLETERAGGAVGSRAHVSIVVVERLLDLFRIHGAERLEFDRRGFAWEIELGRWDASVFAALEEKLERQRSTLLEALRGAWGGDEAARIGCALLASLERPVAALVEAHAARTLERPILDYAVFAARAHVNRLGGTATQEATVRYWAWRLRGGGPGPGP